MDSCLISLFPCISDSENDVLEVDEPVNDGSIQQDQDGQLQKKVSDSQVNSTNICEGPSTSHQKKKINALQCLKAPPLKRSLSSPINEPQAQKKKISEFMFRTTKEEKINIDLQLGRYIFATNSSFRSVEHTDFRKLSKLLNPSYTPPNRHEIGGKILDAVYEEEIEAAKSKLSGQTVSLDLDGWSNIHNEPVICASIVTEDNDSYLVKTIDTSGHKHDTKYLTELVTSLISEVTRKFDVTIRSLVTDNAANMVAMRKELKKELGIITIGCAAHIANLLPMTSIFQI